MVKIAVLVPIYKDDLDPFECYSLNHSLSVLAGRNVFFIGPKGMDRRFYSEHYGSVPCRAFDAPYFESVSGYNRLLLSPEFYAHFIDYEFVLILQTDAVILRDELEFWCEQPFDYIGAPWPEGVELFVNVGKFEGDRGKRVRVYVGNGGLSLRRVCKCLSLLKEFGDIVGLFERTGSSEDLFFSFMGALSRDFIIPNEIIASRFSLELKPAYYYAVNGGRLPMGAHAWWKYEPDFWRAHLSGAPPLPSKG